MSRPRVDLAQSPLFEVHRAAKRALHQKQAELPALRAELARTRWIAANGLAEDRPRARKRLAELRHTVRDLEGAFEAALYLLRAQPLLEQYAARTQLTTSFLGPRQRPRREPGLKPAAELAAEFLRVAREYVDVVNHTAAARAPTCQNCGASSFEVNDTVYTCSTCGEEQELFSGAPSFRDTRRITRPARVPYSRKEHFVEAMNQYQGRRAKPVPEHVYETLCREMRAHGLTKKTTTRDHLYEFLGDNGLGKYYVDLTHIHCNLTGATPPNISHLEPQLLALFDETERPLRAARAPRTNSLNVNYKLLKLLQHLKYPCKRSDFYILKTRSKWDEHEAAWEEMRVAKGWPFTPTVL